MLTKQKLPSAALKKILKDYDLEKIKKIQPLATSGNITFLIVSQTGKFILRLCPKGERWRSKEEILAELELINYLMKNGFPTPKPVSKRNNQRIINWQNHFGYLKEYSKGKLILNPNLKQIQEFGKLVGWFHSLIENYKTQHQRKHIWDLKETKKWFDQDKKIILNSNFKNADQFIKKIETELSKLYFPDNLPSGMIHEDMGKRHVLWQKNKIIGIIDFDRCYYGKLLLDLGQTCRGWCFVENWSKWSNKNLRALLQSYDQKRKLTNSERRYLFDAINFAVLERALSFCLRYLEETKDKEDEKFVWHSISKLLGMLKDNKTEIQQIIKAA